MNRTATLSILAGLLLLATPAAVHAATDPPYPDGVTTFATIDSVEVVGHLGMRVSGILDGHSQAQELQFGFYDEETSQRCHKQALLAMDRPGRYFLVLTYADSGSYYCKLQRR